MSNDQQYVYGAANNERAAQEAARAQQRRIEELESQVAQYEASKATLRQQFVEEARNAAEHTAQSNARLQAFNAEVTPDMDGQAIMRLAQKHGL